MQSYRFETRVSERINRRKRAIELHPQRDRGKARMGGGGFWESAHIPDKTKGTHSNGLEIRVSESRINQTVRLQKSLAKKSSRMLASHLDVISNVVPKICARMNSAILMVWREDGYPRLITATGGVLRWSEVWEKNKSGMTTAEGVCDVAAGKKQAGRVSGFWKVASQFGG